MSCPKCGSKDVMLLPSNEYVCKKCGHRWPMPQPDYTWIEVEIKKAKLFEKYIDAPVDSCEELVSQLLKELDEKNARLLAAKILLQRAERRKTTPAELKKLYDDAERCFQ
ncbi:MAG: TFIIB-type zinc ribbon-containing protein [Pyrobaculum sp.]|uniref:TFIIB-type zinc ribbon-containing protein n=1 Tax=Pyrobaculum sp. TaxID=2004705 RepID=UPI003CB4F2C2